jgi:CDP-paratose 2-epimerase
VRILITGACGFVGSVLAETLLAGRPGLDVFGMDNFIRPGSERNRAALKKLGVKLVHGDIRAASDFESLPKFDYVIDAAANPSVLAGVDGKTSSRQLVEHNLGGTINLLERCKRDGAGFILLSTSRVYAIEPLAALPVQSRDDAFQPDPVAAAVPGLGPSGVDETFSTRPPVSLYGATKLTSEALALEYGLTFDFPVWINRCGVLAGAGQFGRPDQGIFSYWIHSWRAKRPLNYIGFNGRGHQVRDCLHPRDLGGLLLDQMEYRGRDRQRVQNLSGGVESAMSLAQLSRWCRERFGDHAVGSDPRPRPFDIPWIVLDASLAARQWGWRPETPRDDILEEIARHAEANHDWLTVSEPL